MIDDNPKVFWTLRTDSRVSDRIYFTLICDEAREVWHEPGAITELLHEMEATDFDAIKNRFLMALREIQCLPVPVE